MSVLKLTIEQLNGCPNFKLISMDENILGHYAQAVSDLNQLAQFQQVISRTIDLLGQAGEVYTVYQFKEQMSLMLQQIEHFIDDSSVHIEGIIRANTQAYHKAIQDKQNLSFLKKLLTSEKAKLKTFIHNQDTLAQFPSTSADLLKTSHTLKEEVHQVIGHLNQPKIHETNFAAIAGKAQELNALMNSMHYWVKVQYENKGLEAPKAPEKLKLLPKAEPRYSNKRHISFIESSQKPAINSNLTSQQPLSIYPNNQLLGITATPENYSVQPPAPYNNTGIYLGLIVLIPVGALALYLVYRSQNKPTVMAEVEGRIEAFGELKNRLDDLIVQMKAAKESDGGTTDDEYDYFIQRYKVLGKKAESGHYYVNALNELYEDMQYFLNEYYIPSANRSK